MGQVFWITGLSGSGKTTLCRKLVTHLKKMNRSAIMLDGDELRDAMGVENMFSREQRIATSKSYSRICKMLVSQGFDVAIATISMFDEVFTWNRENMDGYKEIYLNVPIEELKRRDSKKIYQRFSSGEIKNVVGIDLEADEPVDADVRIDWREGLTADDALNLVIVELKLGEKSEDGMGLQ